MHSTQLEDIPKGMDSTSVLYQDLIYIR